MPIYSTLSAAAKHKVCVHLRKFGECSDPQCSHFDTRLRDDLAGALFGKDANSAAAAALFKQDSAEYERQRKIAVSRGLLAPRLSDKAKALEVDLDEF